MTDQEHVDATAAKLEEFRTELLASLDQGIDMAFIYKFKDASGQIVGGEAVITDLTISKITKKSTLTVTPPAP